MLCLGRAAKEQGTQDLDWKVEGCHVGGWRFSGGVITIQKATTLLKSVISSLDKCDLNPLF